MRALLDGRFEEGEQLAQAALAIGHPLRHRMPGLSTFPKCSCSGENKVVCGAGARGSELRGPSIDYHRHRALRAPAAQRLGNGPEALELFEQLAATEFADVPRDALWLVSMILVAQTCVPPGQPRAATLYGILKPYATINGVLGYGATCTGSPPVTWVFWRRPCGAGTTQPRISRTPSR
jgi:hypothetical protein